VILALPQRKLSKARVPVPVVYTPRVGVKCLRNETIGTSRTLGLHCTSHTDVFLFFSALSSKPAQSVCGQRTAPKVTCTISFVFGSTWYSGIYTQGLLPGGQGWPLATLKGRDLRIVFTARCTLVQSAVLRSHVVCLSVCNFGEL